MFPSPSLFPLLRLSFSRRETRREKETQADGNESSISSVLVLPVIMLSAVAFETREQHSRATGAASRLSGERERENPDEKERRNQGNKKWKKKSDARDGEGEGKNSQPDSISRFALLPCIPASGSADDMLCRRKAALSLSLSLAPSLLHASRACDVHNDSLIIRRKESSGKSSCPSLSATLVPSLTHSLMDLLSSFSAAAVAA